MSILQKTSSAAGSTIGFLTGYTVLKNTLSTTKKIVADSTAIAGWEFIKACIDRLSYKPSGRVETFAQACTRLGVTAADYPAIAARLSSSASLYRRVGTVGLIATLVSAAMADGFFWFILETFAGLCFAGLLYSYAIRQTFRLWQLERRELASFAEFRRDSGIVRSIVG